MLYLDGLISIFGLEYVSAIENDCCINVRFWIFRYC